MGSVNKWRFDDSSCASRSDKVYIAILSIKLHMMRILSTKNEKNITSELWPRTSVLNRYAASSMTSNQWCFPGETRGNAVPHLFYQGNGVPPAKIKRGGTPFSLTGINYELNSVNTVWHHSNNFGITCSLVLLRVIFGNNSSASHVDILQNVIVSLF